MALMFKTFEAKIKDKNLLLKNKLIQILTLMFILATITQKISYKSQNN